MGSRKFTEAQVRMLKGAAGGDAFAGIHGMSASGGATGTALSLRRRGLLDNNNQITEAGRTALKDFRQ